MSMQIINADPHHKSRQTYGKHTTAPSWDCVVIVELPGEEPAVHAQMTSSTARRRLLLLRHMQVVRVTLADQRSGSTYCGVREHRITVADAAAVAAARQEPR
jgi:hypothetical protein